MVEYPKITYIYYQGSTPVRPDLMGGAVHLRGVPCQHRTDGSSYLTIAISYTQIPHKLAFLYRVLSRYKERYAVGQTLTMRLNIGIYNGKRGIKAFSPLNSNIQYLVGNNAQRVAIMTN